MATIQYVGKAGAGVAESRYEKERADRLAMENALLRGEMVDVKGFNEELQKGFAELRTMILRSELKAQSQDKLLRRLESIKKNVQDYRPPFRSFFHRNV
jgi:hypothetical protein